MISKFFIERPVLANVLAILMILIGAVALYGLPISQYPNVVPPTVQVTTTYPGASARTLMDTVALPIEQQVNGVENMIYMQSTSASDGSYTLTVTFNIGTDLDTAQVLVQNRVASALASLPDAVQSQGVTVQKKATAILLFVALTSPDNRYTTAFILPTMPPSAFGTSCRVCRASATSILPAPANIRCACGSTRTSSRREA
jgi:HAE1 family hydrophobic/amphiphilic exporter-1